MRRILVAAVAAAVAFCMGAPQINISVSVFDKVSQVVSAIAFILTIIITAATKSYRILPKAIIFTIIFFLWQLMSIEWSIFPDLTVWRSMVNTQFFMVLFVIWQSGNNEKAFVIVSSGYITGCLLSASNIFWNLGMGYPTGGADLRFTAYGQDPNELGMKMVVASLLSIIMAKMSCSRLLKIVFLLLAFSFIPAVMLTGSRTAFICLAVSAVMVLIFESSKNRTIIALILLIICISTPYILPANVKERLTSSFDSQVFSDAGGRAEIWRQAPELFSASPFIGSGAGTFAEHLRQEYNFGRPPHNAFLSVAIDSGLAGLIIYLSIVYLIYATVITSSKCYRPYLISGYTSWLISSLTISLDFELVTWGLFGLFLLSPQNADTQVEIDSLVKKQQQPIYLRLVKKQLSTTQWLLNNRKSRN